MKEISCFQRIGIMASTSSCKEIMRGSAPRHARVQTLDPTVIRRKTSLRLMK